MPKQVRLLQIADLAHKETLNQILLDTLDKTELNIYTENDKTIIQLPYGNKFDIIDGRIIIKNL